MASADSSFIDIESIEEGENVSLVEFLRYFHRDGYSRFLSIREIC